MQERRDWWNNDFRPVRDESTKQQPKGPCDGDGRWGSIGNGESFRLLQQFLRPRLAIALSECAVGLLAGRLDGSHDERNPFCVCLAPQRPTHTPHSGSRQPTAAARGGRDTPV
ncbi:unnamed protein product [Toxocara canis]|uniref:Uncharacterized protein n=1 Tax=Toxocara canis TaxID=6265 RepID=A0A183V8C1_TOXCA|nr:unnamed protein product [Toxocara canis]